jgi:hypothetical protein
VAAPIFLLGPPGVGKTTLGTRACSELTVPFRPYESIESALSWAEVLPCVLEVPWEEALEPRMLERLRKAGVTIALWDHPERMQARASRPYTLRGSTALVRPGTYGRRGTSCVEFRRLDRGCDHVRLIDGLSLDEACEELRSTIEDAWTDGSAEELEAWTDEFVRLWRADTTVKKPAAQPLAAAMAEFLLASKRAGASARAMRALESDLHVGGLLYFYDGDSTTAARALASFAAGAAGDSTRFARKITDRPAAVARYERALAAFASFLSSRAR